MAINPTPYDTIGSSESHVSSHKPIIEGYFIHRPTHVEINVKSPYLANLMKNDKDLVYSDFGMVYDVDFDEDQLLYQSMNKNNNTFLTSNHNANISYLRSPKLHDGFKTKIRGIIFPEDLVTYEHKFNSLVAHLVRHLTKPKPKKVTVTNSRLRTIRKIRAGSIYDGNGWVHATNCACRFGSEYGVTMLCDKCNSYNVGTGRNSDVTPLRVCFS